MSTTTANQPTQERAPCLLVFGPLATRVAAILRARPSLIATIAFAPPEAIHSIAAYLYLAPGAAKSDVEVADIIERSDLRELLNTALPGCPPRLYRALGTAGNMVHDQSFYERVGFICRGPFGLFFLDGGNLTSFRLDFYEAMQTMDPLIVNLRGAVGETLHTMRAVDSLVSLIRSHAGLDECDLRLSKNAGTKAVLRRLLKGLYSLRAPLAPFVVPPPFRLVETIGEVRDIGRKFGNCVAGVGQFGTNHWFQLVDGSTVYLTGDDPQLLIALSRAGPNLWYIEQMAGPKNQAPTIEEHTSVESALREAGVKLVSVNPAHALSQLYRASRRARAINDNDLEDDELDDMIDELNDII